MTAPTLRADGLLDVVRGLRPGAAGQTYAGAYFLPALLYETDGIARNIVDRPAEDAISRGFVVEGDADAVVLNELDRLDAFQHLTDGLRAARLEGASAVLMLAEDGGALEDPLDPARLRRLDDLLVFPRTGITPGSDLYDDPRRREYGRPLRYMLTPAHGGAGFWVHDTRLLKLTGDPAPPSGRLGATLHWEGRSALDGCRSDLERYRAGLRLAEAVLERKQQGIYGMAGLAELLATVEGKQFVQEKLALVDAVRGLLNTVAIDAGPGNKDGTGDTYQIADLSVGGIDSLLNSLKIALCASSGFPAPILFGEDLRGLGTVGTGEQTIYHAKVRAIQERNVRPAIETLAPLIWAQAEVRASEPTFWRVDLNPLLAPSEAEEADVALKKAQARKVAAEAVQVALDTGAVSPEEGRDLLRETAFEQLPAGPPPEPELPDDTTEADGGADAEVSAGGGTGLPR